MTTRLLLVRHGDRYDYANLEAWRTRCQRQGLEPSDPPLSALGHQQARETAAALELYRPDVLLCSPYLRVLQTVQPLAHACSQRICVDDALAEFRHDPALISISRLAVFPEIDESYDPMLRLTEAGPESEEDYFRRLLLLAREVTRRYTGQTVALFSHAASVALVGALTGCELVCDAGTFAPCGIYSLVTDDAGATWRVESRGDTNQPHVTRNVPSTYAWGFCHSRSSKRIEATWQSALRLGPTDAHQAKAPEDARWDGVPALPTARASVRRACAVVATGALAAVGLRFILRAAAAGRGTRP